MSASYLVDLENTTIQGVSILGTPVLSGALVAPCSGAIIGQSLNFINGNTFTNVFVTGVTASGVLRVQVQTSDTDTSGTYTDPTSGLPQLPTSFSSGGLLIINSGGAGGGDIGALVSGNAVASGFFTAAGFQRPGQFVRANLLSGDFGAGPLVVGFISNLKVTGSGGGFSYLPTSGTVNV